MDLKEYNLDLLEDYNADDLVVTLDSSINEEKTKRYLNIFTNQDHREIISVLIEKTTYITYVQFVNELLKNFNSLKNIVSLVSSFHVMLGDKFGSEIWVIAHFYKYLKKLTNFKGFIQHLDSDVENVVIFDDCIYSGGNIGSFIDGSTYLFSKKKNIKQKNVNVRFIVSVPYAIPEGAAAVKDTFKYVTLNIGKYIDSIDLGALTQNYIDWLNSINIMTYDKKTVCLYFQHKVAIDASTLESVYVKGYGETKETKFGTILNNIPDRKSITNLEKFLRK
jgi:hypothetical protein